MPTHHHYILRRATAVAAALSLALALLVVVQAPSRPAYADSPTPPPAAAPTVSMDVADVSTLANIADLNPGLAVIEDDAFISTGPGIKKVNLADGSVTTLVAGSSSNDLDVYGSSGSSSNFGGRGIKSLSVYDGFLYGVTSYNALVKIDPVSGSVQNVTSTYLSSGPTAGVVSADGQAYVAGGYQPATFQKVDVASGSITNLTVTGMPNGSVNALAVDASNLWLTLPEKIIQIDLGTLAVVHIYQDPTVDGVALISSGDYLYASTGGNFSSRVGRMVRRISKNDGSGKNIAGSTTSGTADGLGARASFNNVLAISAHGDELVVADDIGKLKRLTGGIKPALAPKPAVNFPTATVSTVANMPLGINGVVTLGNYAYVPYGCGMFKVDLTSEVVSTFVPPSSDCGNNIYGSTGATSRFYSNGGVTDLFTDGTFLYGLSGGYLVRINPDTGAVSQVNFDQLYSPNTSGGPAQAAAMGPDGRVYVAVGYRPFSMFRVDVDSGRAERFDIPGVPVGTVNALTVDQQYLWAAQSDSISKISLADFSVVQVYTDPAIDGAALVDAGDYLYASTGGNSPYHELSRTVRQITKLDFSSRSVAGSSNSGRADGRGTDASFDTISGIAVSDNALYVSDKSGALRKLMLDENFTYEQSQESSTNLDLGRAQVRTLAALPAKGEGVVSLGNYAYAAAGCGLARVNMTTGATTELVKYAATSASGSHCSLFSSYNGATSSFGSGGVKDMFTDGSYLYGLTGYELVRINPVSGAVSQVNTDYISATAATLGPDGYVYISGYASDTPNKTRLSKIDLRSGRVTPLTLNSTMRVDPNSLTADADNLYAANYDSIMKIDFATLTPTVLMSSYDIVNEAIASAGDYLYIAQDPYRVALSGSTLRTNTVMRCSKSGDGCVPIAGGFLGFVNGQGSDAQFASITGFWLSGNKLLVSDYSNQALRIVIPGPGGAQGASMIQSVGEYNRTLVQHSEGQLLPSETVGGTNPSMGNEATREHGDPVSTLTGEFATDATDAMIAGQGLPLTFSRTYASQQANTLGAMGYGWTHGYDMRVRVGTGNELGFVTVRQEDGSLAYFADNGDGTYSGPSRLHATLTRNTDQTWTFVRRGEATFIFGSDGTLRLMRDRRGTTNTFTYTNNRLSSVTDSTNRSLGFTYNSSGRLISVTAPGQRVTSYGYTNDNLTSVTAPDTTVTAYSYNAAHQLTGITDQTGRTLTNAYDSSGRVTSQHDDLNRTTGYQYLNETAYGTHQALITLPDGTTTLENYEKGRVASETAGWGSPLATTTTYQYDQNGNPSIITDALGRTATTTWNADGQPLTLTDASGRITSWSYQAGRVATVTTPDGNTASLTYNQYGDVLTSAQTSGGLTRNTSYAYDALGNLTSVVDPFNRVTSYTYDQYGYPVSVTDPLGRRSSSTVDVNGQVLSSTSALGNVSGISTTDRERYTTHTTYDSVGQVVGLTDELDRTSTYAYDDAGRLASSTDPLGRVTTQHYDAVGDLSSTTRPDGKTVSVVRDGAGRVVSSIDASGNSTSQTYDLLGRLSSRTDQLGRTSSVSYDLVGNVILSTDPLGRTVSHTYDADDQMLTSDYSDPGTPDVTVGYDALGRPVSTTDGSGTSSSNYNARGLLNSTTDGQGAVVGYQYDNLDRLSSLTYPSGRVVSYQYDMADQLTTLTDNQPNAPPQVYAYTYDLNGQPTSLTYPNGVVETDAWTIAGELSNIGTKSGSTTLDSWGYQYDDGGQQVSVTSPQASLRSTYDQLGRVTGRSDGSTTADITQSDTGDVTSVDNHTQTFGVDGALQTRGNPGLADTSYQYDGVGNRTSRTAPLSNSSFTLNGDASAHDQSSIDLTDNATFQKGSAILKNTVDSSNLEVTFDVDLSDTGSWVPGDGMGLVLLDPSMGDNALGTDGASLGFGGLTGMMVGIDTFGNPGDNTYDAVTLKNWGTSTNDTWDANSSRLADLHTGIHQFKVNLDTSLRVYYDGTLVLSAPRSAGITSDVLVGFTAATGGATERHEVSVKDVSVNSTSLTDNTSYQWNSDGTLSGITGTSAVSYQYDGAGLRTGKTINGNTEHFSWDRAAGLPQLLSDAGHEYLYTPSGNLLSQTDSSGVTQYVHTDSLGSVRMLTDSSGTMVGNSDYSVYGTRTGTGIQSHFGFSGQYHDDESGLIYLRARYYEPQSAQFISLDPLWAESGDNYAYASGNPLQLSDPSGQLTSTGAHIRNFIGGAADSATFGVSTLALDLLGVRGAFDRCTEVFTAGGTTLTGVEISIAVVTAVPTLGGSLALAGGEAGAAVGFKSVAKHTSWERITGWFKQVGKRCVNSFADDTLISTPDGQVPISSIQVGDQVITTDPISGETEARTVTATHVNLDHEFTDLMVEHADGTTETIHTTEHHEFWSDSDNGWVDAGNLHAGDQLIGGTVNSVASFSGSRTMYNLSVSGVHTFSVAGVVVHNCDGLVYNSRSQLQKKFASHKTVFGFGENESFNNRTQQEFIKRLNDHVRDSNTQHLEIVYRGDVVHSYLNADTGIVAIGDAQGEFISAWKLTAPQLNRVLTEGTLGLR